MPKDFAKRNQVPATEVNIGSHLTWFVMGLAVGMFVSFLFYLWYFVPEDPSVAAEKPTSEVISDQQILEIDYDFYGIFPEAEVPIVEEYDQSGKKVLAESNYAYLLQAGSFRDQEDADRLRAKLILQGFEVVVRQVEQASGTWHRVIAGPFESEREMIRARNRLAEANVETITLQVKR